MAEMIAESQELESTTIGIYRTAAVVKGGRRFSFSAMVVVGDRRGKVGLGYGKATGVPNAIEKAHKEARKALFDVPVRGGTVPHPVEAAFGASRVRLLPAAPGTGVIAGGTVRAVLEMAGVHDCLTKAYGSTNQKNLAKATLDALLMLRRKDEVAALRGVDLGTTTVEEMIEVGRRYAPVSSTTGDKAKGPVSKVGGKERGGKGRRGGGRRGGGRGGQPAEAQAAGEAAAAAPAPEAAAPAPEAPAPGADGEQANQQTP